MFAITALPLLALAAITTSALAQTSGSAIWWAGSDFHSKESITWPPGSNHKLFHNVVEDYGADNTGQTDASDAFNKAIVAGGNRCAGPPDYEACNSSTATPSFIYIPPGKYKMLSTVTLFYMTNLIGDPLDKPVFLVGNDYDISKGQAWLFDTDPYMEGGANWYANQNNFFRQIRNVVIDMTAATDATLTGLTGIHWQVAQATSLYNIDFKLAKGTNQVGIFSENGSGGFMSDLTFTGGSICAQLGSQQFTSRSLTFTDCPTAIAMIWTWGWVFHNISITGSDVGINMTGADKTANFGTVLVMDSVIDASVHGILTDYDLTTAGKSGTVANGSTNGLVLDNVHFVSQGVSQDGVQPNGQVNGFLQGSQYVGNAASVKSVNNGNTQTVLDMPTADVLKQNGKFYARSKPQYTDKTTADILLLKDCDGYSTYASGTNDASDFLTKAFEQAAGEHKILYVNYAAFLVSKTVYVPPGLQMVGEMWPIFLVDGSSPSFNDASNPRVAFMVGQDGGEDGEVEMSDLIFSIKGPAPGAIVMKWNLKSATPTLDSGSGLWDVHIRVGGTVGTELTAKTCGKQPYRYENQQVVGLQSDDQTRCDGVHTMFWASEHASNLLMENNWFWVADHDFEDPLNAQVDIFSTRGVLIESPGPIWMWATASEHSVLYNYQFNNAKDIFMGFTQTETPYYQPLLTSLHSVTLNASMGDPESCKCHGDATSPDGIECIETWGMRILDSQNIHMYGLGYYSFFRNYDQTCLKNHGKCQTNMISVSGDATKDVYLYGITTIAATNMITFNGVGVVKGDDQPSMFGDALTLWASN